MTLEELLTLQRATSPAASPMYGAAPSSLEQMLAELQARVAAPGRSAYPEMVTPPIPPSSRQPIFPSRQATPAEVESGRSPWGLTGSRQIGARRQEPAPFVAQDAPPPPPPQAPPVPLPPEVRAPYQRPIADLPPPTGAPPSRPLGEMSEQDLSALLAQVGAGRGPRNIDPEALREVYNFRMDVPANRPNQIRPMEPGDGGPPVERIADRAQPAGATTGPAEPPAVDPSVPAELSLGGIRAAANLAPSTRSSDRPGGTLPSGSAPTPGGGSSRIPEANYGPMWEAMNNARPGDVQPDQSRVWQMALLGALGNLAFTPGERLGFGLARAIPGGAQGAAREMDTQRGLQRENQREQRGWSRDLAGMLGSTEDRRVDRAFRGMEFDANQGYRNASLDLQRQGLTNQTEQLRLQGARQDLQTQLLQARTQALLRQAGIDQNAGAVLMEGAPRIAEGRLTIPGFTLPGPNGTRLSVGDAYRTIITGLQRRESLVANPLFATNPRLVENQARLQLSQAITEHIATLPEEERSRIISWVARNQQRSPRQGSALSGLEELD